MVKVHRDIFHFIKQVAVATCELVGATSIESVGVASIARKAPKYLRQLTLDRVDFRQVIKRRVYSGFIFNLFKEL